MTKRAELTIPTESRERGTGIGNATANGDGLKTRRDRSAVRS